MPAQGEHGAKKRSGSEESSGAKECTAERSSDPRTSEISSCSKELTKSKPSSTSKEQVSLSCVRTPFKFPPCSGRHTSCCFSKLRVLPPRPLGCPASLRDQPASAPSQHSSRILFPGNALVHTSAGFVAVSTFSSFNFPSTRDSCNQTSLKPTCFEGTLWRRRFECEGDGDVVGVVTPLVRGGAQVFAWRSGCRAQCAARSA